MTTGTEKPRRYLLYLDAFSFGQTRMGRAIARKEVFRIDSDQLAVQNGLIDAADRAAELVRRLMRWCRFCALRRGPVRDWTIWFVLLSLASGVRRGRFHALLLQDWPRLGALLRRLLGLLLRQLGCMLLRGVDAGTTDIVVLDDHAAHDSQALLAARLRELVAPGFLRTGGKAGEGQAAKKNPAPALQVPDFGVRWRNHWQPTG